MPITLTTPPHPFALYTEVTICTLTKWFLLLRSLGDILLNVNGIELREVSRSEAVALLKSTSSSVVLKALEVQQCEPQEDGSSPAALDANHNMTPPGDWSPSWVMWLELPR